MTDRWRGARIHFIGIGGAGMSGLALVAHRLGAEVSGSDRGSSSYLERLLEAGIEARVGHDPANLPAEGEVVVSTAIAEDNPELAAARERGMPVLHRSDLLARLCSGKRTIAVAGTHGKTTTTAMIAWAMRELGLDPAFFVGGELPGAGPGGGAANSGWGEGEWVVVEADESDGSFLALDPEIAVVTNVEMDHHSRWTGLAELRSAFTTFLLGASGVVLPADDPELLEPGAEAEPVYFSGAAPGPESVPLAVPGEHNLLDARAAIGAMALAGVDPADAAGALAGFPGVKRRLELKGETPGGARVYDDYAHHPTEVRASLAALRELGPGRLVAVFQPHLYSRTKAFAEEFGAALAEADEIVVLDVYPAREQPVGPLEGVDGLMVARAAADRAGGRPVRWAPSLEHARRAVEAADPGPGGTVVTIGAGDVTRLSDRLVAEGAAR